MKDTLQTIGKIIFPVVLTLFGLWLVLMAVTGGQNTYFLMGGLATTVTGIFSLLMVMGFISSQLQKISVFVFLAIAAVISFFSFRSITDPIEFEKAKNLRYEAVKNRLKDIRMSELSYKSVNGKYAASFDSLIHFLKNDNFLVVKAIGAVPDGMTEKEAIEKGYAKRDTFYVSVKDSIFARNLSKIDSLPFIPFGEGEKFKITTGEIVKGPLTIQVIEVYAPNIVIFKGLTDQFYDKETGLKIGSMTEASTNGNWE